MIIIHDALAWLFVKVLERPLMEIRRTRAKRVVAGSNWENSMDESRPRRDGSGGLVISVVSSQSFVADGNDEQIRIYAFAA